MHFTEREEKAKGIPHTSACMHACVQRAPVRLGSGSQQGPSISHDAPSLCVTFRPLLQLALLKNIIMSWVTHPSRDATRRSSRSSLHISTMHMMDIIWCNGLDFHNVFSKHSKRSCWKTLISHATLISRRCWTARAALRQADARVAANRPLWS